VTGTPAPSRCVGIDAHGMRQTNNVNLRQVNDARIQNAVTKLHAIGRIRAVSQRSHP
jgi:hypothetical protein